VATGIDPHRLCGTASAAAAAATAAITAAVAATATPSTPQPTSLTDDDDGLRRGRLTEWPIGQTRLRVPRRLSGDSDYTEIHTVA